MTTRYTVFNGKEYVSLRRYWNMQGKYETLKAKCDELEKENKELKEENKKLQNKLNKLKKIYVSKHMEKEIERLISE